MRAEEPALLLPADLDLRLVRYFTVVATHRRGRLVAAFSKSACDCLTGPDRRIAT